MADAAGGLSLCFFYRFPLGDEDQEEADRLGLTACQGGPGVPFLGWDWTVQRGPKYPEIHHSALIENERQKPGFSWVSRAVGDLWHTDKF